MRVNLSEINKVADALMDCGKYNISFASIPSSGLVESQIVSKKCYSITLPNEEVDVIDVNIHGHHVAHRGLKKQTKTFSASFYNNGSGWTDVANAVKIPMDSYRIFKDWIDRVASIETQASASKSMLTTSLESYVSDTTSSLIGTGANAVNNLTNLTNTTIGSAIGTFITDASQKITTSKKNLYTCPECLIDIYNQANVLQSRFIFKNVFPISIKGITLGDYKNTLSTEVTFSFDYFYCTDVLTTKALSVVDIAERSIKDRLDFLPF